MKYITYNIEKNDNVDLFFDCVIIYKKNNLNIIKYIKYYEHR